MSLRASPSRPARALLERIAAALEKLASRGEGAPETMDVHEAAAFLKTTARALYVRHQRGQMPPPIPGKGKKLVWRKSDLERGA